MLSKSCCDFITCPAAPILWWRGWGMIGYDTIGSFAMAGVHFTPLYLHRHSTGVCHSTGLIHVCCKLCVHLVLQTWRKSILICIIPLYVSLVRCPVVWGSGYLGVPVLGSIRARALQLIWCGAQTTCALLF